jgi:exodeoxyribonuclease V alpha subunit
MESLEAEVYNIVFKSDKGDFTVAKVTTEEGKLKTVVGKLAGVQPGEFVKLSGKWIEDDRYGEQFSVDSFMVQTPKTLVGLERYLSSGILPGVGKKTAERIVDQFKEETLNVLQETPERLHEVSGIGAKRLEEVVRAWALRSSFNEVIAFLQSFGISATFAERINKRYGDQSVSVLKSNPYRLAWDVRGIGFKKADQIALEMGFATTSPERAAAATIHFLKTAADQGHVFYPLDRLIQEVMPLLEVDEDVVGTGVRLAISDDLVVLDEVEWNNDDETQIWRGHALYLRKHYQAECGTANELKRFLDQEPHHASEVSQRFPWLLDELKKRHGLELGSEQAEALENSLLSRVSVITGGPGTGKTTMVRALLFVMNELGQNVLLAAPTGRAAKRLSEATKNPAKTLHRLLEYRPGQGEFGGFARNPSNRLDCDVLVVDETSMVDIFMIFNVLRAMPDHASLVLVGDIDQLPSVGSGSVLRDVMDSSRATVTHLVQIYRQARGSWITVNAHNVNKGIFPKFFALDQTYDEEEGEIDCFFVKEENPKRTAKVIQSLCQTLLPKRFDINPFEDIQIITPMHKGDVGSINLNKIMQETLNPTGDAVKRGERIFRLQDRVMQIRNNYDKDVFNGDIGQVLHIDYPAEEITVRFDYVEATYNFDELDELELAYSITVHKSQGSEYPVVILPMTTQHFIMLQRNLLYTAITRGRMLVVLVGSSKAIALALNNDKMAKRYTNLARRIRGVTL